MMSHELNDFTAIHIKKTDIRMAFWSDEFVSHGEAMDAPDVLPIGCTSNCDYADLAKRGE